MPRAAPSAALLGSLFTFALLLVPSWRRPSPSSPFCALPVDAPRERFYGQTDGGGPPFDRLVHERFFNQSCYGTFVDVGANDGLTYSQSKFFEERLGWRGLCIEPQPEVFAQLRANRPLCGNLNIGIGDEERPLTFVQVHGPASEDNMLSGFKQFMDDRHRERIRGKPQSESQVSVVRLDRVLEAAGIREIDLLSIDTEGNELSVLRSLLGSGVTFEVLVVETNYQKAREAEMRAFMREHRPRCSEEKSIAWNLVFRCRPPAGG